MTYAVIGIISRKNSDGQDEYLLVSSKRDFGEFTGRYYPPGGHLEDGEDEKSGLIREIREELNLDVVPTERIGETGSDVKDQVTYWWRCDIVGGEFKFDSHELADARWFTQSQIEQMQLWPTAAAVLRDSVFPKQ